MSWSDSLIRISTYEVDELQKRLKEVLDRQDAVEQAIDTLDLEAEEEKLRASVDPSVAWCHPDYLKAWKLRRARLEAQLTAITLEAEGARDALAEAYEALKKVEHVAELARLQQARTDLRIENAGLDEIALRNSHNARQSKRS